MNKPNDYDHTIKHIVATEHIDTWIPFPGAHAMIVDPDIAKDICEERIGGLNGCENKTSFLSPVMHWESRIEDLCKELRFAVPESKTVSHISDAIDFLQSAETLSTGHRCLLKSLRAEYCTHVAARDRIIVAFVACPRNPLIILPRRDTRGARAVDSGVSPSLQGKTVVRRKKRS